MPVSQKPRFELPLLILWLIPLLTYLGMLFIVAPGRGAAWFSDDGLFLRMSWDAANGFGWDKMLPQSPSYLFDALMMKLGMMELLYFRWLNISLCFFAGTFLLCLRSSGFPISRYTFGHYCQCIGLVKFSRVHQFIGDALFFAGRWVLFLLDPVGSQKKPSAPHSECLIFRSRGIHAWRCSDCRSDGWHFDM